MKNKSFQILAGAGIAGLLFLAGCGRETEEANPAEVDRFLAQMKAEEEANRAAAVAAARSEEEQRKQAGDRRIRGYEEGRSKEPADLERRSR